LACSISLNSCLRRVTKSSVVHPAPFIEVLNLGLNDAFLGGRALPANVIYLLLQGAAVGNLTVQRGLECRGLALQCRTLGLGSRDLLPQRVAVISGRLQLSWQGLDDRLQRGNRGRDGIGGSLIINLDMNGLAPRAYLLRTSGEHLGRYADFGFKGVISDAPGPLRAPCPRYGSAGPTQA
jgi:hypothetical protein